MADGVIQIKVEPDLFYQACDQLGLMVIQDMPSLPASGDRKPDSKQQAEFKRQLEVVINQHKNYASIVTWVRKNHCFGASIFKWLIFLGHLQ